MKCTICNRNKTSRTKIIPLDLVHKGKAFHVFTCKEHMIELNNGNLTVGDFWIKAYKNEAL